MYCIAALKHAEDGGYRPALPDDVPSLLLADTPKYGLYKCDVEEELVESDSVHLVSDELHELLESAMDYPPALALARDESQLGWKCSMDEFEDRLKERLTHYLQGQKDSPFFMARAVRDELGYKNAGGYYWIVRYKDGEVRWVSRDYFVYTGLISDFDLDTLEMERLFDERRG